MTILIYQNIFLCSLACESCYSKSGYLFPDWSWVEIRDSQVNTRRLVLKKTVFLRGRVRWIWFAHNSPVCSDEGLTLETSAKHHIPRATNISYQPCWSNPYSQVKSRQSRLIRGAWTLLQGFWGVPGDASPEKIRNLRSSNCWKCTEIVNLTITVLFLYHFKYFTIPLGGPFWFLRGGGGGVRAHPAHPTLPTGLGYCKHDKQLYLCKECATQGTGGKSSCQHNNRRYICVDCNGKGVCKHGKQKYFCADCNVRGMCLHNKHKDFCKICSNILLPDCINN